jgi:hypothetical protein
MKRYIYEYEYEEIVKASTRLFKERYRKWETGKTLMIPPESLNEIICNRLNKLIIEKLIN